MPLTQSQLADAVAERAELSKAEAKRALTALEEVVLDEIGNAQKVKIGSIVQFTVRMKPATKAFSSGRKTRTGVVAVTAAGRAAASSRLATARASAAGASEPSGL